METGGGISSVTANAGTMQRPRRAAADSVVNYDNGDQSDEDSRTNSPTPILNFIIKEKRAQPKPLPSGVARTAASTEKKPNPKVVKKRKAFSSDEEKGEEENDDVIVAPSKKNSVTHGINISVTATKPIASDKSAHANKKKIYSVISDASSADSSDVEEVSSPLPARNSSSQRTASLNIKSYADASSEEVDADDFVPSKRNKQNPPKMAKLVHDTRAVEKIITPKTVKNTVTPVVKPPVVTASASIVTPKSQKKVMVSPATAVVIFQSNFFVLNNILQSI